MFQGSKILAISLLLTLTRSLITFDLEGLEKFHLQFCKLDEFVHSMNCHFDELPL